MVLLHGTKRAIGETKRWLAQLIKLMSFIFVGTVLLFVVFGKKTSLLVLGIICLAGVPLSAVKDLDKQLTLRRRNIQLEIPIVINQFLLLINAGEPIQKALIRCAAQGNKQSPLFAELKRAMVQLQNNKSLPQVLEQFNRNCGVQEVSIFVNTVLMNYRRGGAELTASLRLLSNQLWQERKTVAKTLGEEASSKLVFPMVLIFGVMIVIIGAPAVMMMNF